MTQDSSEVHRLLRRAAMGEHECLGVLLTQRHDQLRRLVAFRLDPRLHGRLDPSDVIQEVYLAASRSLKEYLAKPSMSFYLWLRGITCNKLLELHRFHLGTPMRDARREISLQRGGLPEASSAALAAQLLGHATRASEIAMRAEIKVLLQEALNGMDPRDREVLALRHFEQLSIAETAEVLGIKEGAAGKRHLRALERLREVLAGLPGGLEL